MEKIKLTKEVEEFLSGHTKITIGNSPADDEYFFVPFWYRKVGGGIYERLDWDNLPKDLVKNIKDVQNSIEISNKEKAWFRTHSPLYDKDGFSVGPEPDNRLAIFFHVAIMQNWEKSFNVIMGHIKKSGIDKKAVFNIFVHGDIKEYSKHARYSGNFYGYIGQARNHTNEFEFPTINEMKHFSEKNPNRKMLYIHTKGASHNDERFKDNLWWLEKLCKDTFYQSELAMNLLDTHDAVGPMISDHPFDHFSGNFFYTTSFHVNRLKFLEMKPEGNFEGKLALNEKFGLRHDCEKWVCSIQGRYRTLS